MKAEAFRVEAKAAVDSRSMNVLLYFSAYHLSLFLEALEANMRVYSPSNTKEKHWLYSTTGSALFQLMMSSSFAENSIEEKSLGYRETSLLRIELKT